MIGDKMDTRIFEGAPRMYSIRKTRTEYTDLEDLREKLNFVNEIDLVVFCASIGMYRVEIERERFIELPSRRELVSINLFEDAELFDRLIIALGAEEKRQKKFEDYFYTGFFVLKKWLEEMEPTLEHGVFGKFSNLMEFVIKSKSDKKKEVK